MDLEKITRNCGSLLKCDIYCGILNIEVVLERLASSIEKNVFTYHQSGHLLWSEYSGGDIGEASLIVTVLSNGEIDFVYHHMNRDM